MTVCCLPESQNAADLCALQQEAVCPPSDPCLFPPCEPTPRFCNVARACECGFEGTTQFAFTIPAGTFCAPTQEAADALANVYACALCGNPTLNVRLGEIDRCTCLGGQYSDAINYEGNTPIMWVITSGSLPDGLTLNAITGLISGTTTASGTYGFTVRAYLADGNYGWRDYTISVLKISTTTIDDFTIGTAYSFQMQAEGGSGNYAWRISAGSLPAGLEMSITGLISGTPTAAGSATVQFQVIDTTCEAANQPYFTPRVSVSTTSQTVVRTRRGYTEYVNPTGVLYKKVTYSGYAKQTAFAVMPRDIFGNVPPPEYCGGAQFIYSGSSEINIYGNFITDHRRDLFVPCTNSPQPLVSPTFVGNIPPVFVLLGYCWVPDPTTCSECSQTPEEWLFKQNYASHSSIDYAVNILSGSVPTSATQTSFSVVLPTNRDFDLRLGNYGRPGDVINFPVSDLGGEADHYINLESDVNYTATLSEPFTAADEIASQLSYFSNGKTSENKPNTLTWVNDFITNIQSRYTSVDYVFSCSNLLEGESYTVRYELNDSDGTGASYTSTFTAGGTTHTIIGSLPTPAAGHTITLRNVRIAYTV